MAVTATQGRSARAALVAYLEAQLIGPRAGNEEVVEVAPFRRYLMGVLYPRNASLQRTPEEEIDAKDLSGDEELVLEPLADLYFQQAPAAMGLSVYMVAGDVLECRVTAAIYIQQPSRGKGRSSKWLRSSLASPTDPLVIRFERPRGRPDLRQTIFDGRAQLHCLWRRWKQGHLVTVTLMNEAIADDGSVDPAKCLFQTGMELAPLDGQFGEYPRMEFGVSNEDEELGLIYRDKITWAIGHGSSVVWDDDARPPSSVRATFLPTYETNPWTTHIPVRGGSPAAEILSLQHLCDLCRRDVAGLERGLEAFIEEYEAWAQAQAQLQIPDNYGEAGQRILARIASTIQRMHEGIRVLVRDPVARDAFALTQHAMLMQVIHYGELEFGKTIRRRDEQPYMSPIYDDPRWSTKRWRPFQLAYQLLVLPTLVNESSSDRDLVDLLWFPTGGGKTEAYLALIAFEIVHRRLRHGAAGAGTVAIMRYTLRLLTSQQFQRATALICALELLRCEQPNRLGSEPITIGFWAGADASPNAFTCSTERNQGALERWQRLLQQDEPENPFQLQQCHWCGTRLVPERGTGIVADYGFEATASSFVIRCPTSSCPFHKRLPVQVVDEGLFSEPPTLLLGTLDKFARLAWDARGRAFLGLDRTSVRSPSLIIQDELHLISGPLGSVAGLYEAALEVAIRERGPRPKILAATATIRNADSQVKALYGREVSVFPPSGLSADDAYYRRIDRDSPGRLYVGVMGQGQSPVRTTVATMASLSQGVLDAGLPESCRDAYWTQVVYHNSKRELGATLTRSKDEVNLHVQGIARDQSHYRRQERVVELSANVRGSLIPNVLQELDVAYPSKQAIDILACTNMLSVGVDVSRLGLMLVMGQPKQSAEYVQATSRVGRDPDRPPGLVVTVYSAARPRDRSHYEGFRSYHQALYREVEPSSVTPCAPRARDRALHAALVTLFRTAGKLFTNESAGEFEMTSEESQRLLADFLARLEQAAPSEIVEVQEHLEVLCNTWQERCGGSKRLRFEAGSATGKAFAGLLRNFGSPESEAWPTLHAMRHVDIESPIRVKGAGS